MKKLSFLIVVIACFGLNEAMGQWGTNGTHIYNTNSGNVGIGTNSPGYLLHVSKNMVAPSIRIQNAGGTGGAAFEMRDNFSGADWKFKATNAGGFKIRDHANGLDVFFIEQNSAANLLYLKSGGNIGIGTSTPDNSALVDISSATKGFLPPRVPLTAANVASPVSSPATGLFVYNTASSGTSPNNVEPGYYCWNGTRWVAVIVPQGTSSGDMLYWNGTQWVSIPAGSSGQILTMTNGAPTWAQPLLPCGMEMTVSHVAGNVAPVSKTVSYSTVSDIPGETSKCWITNNLGADHQASEVDDATEASAGWYWQFNRMQGYKHDGSIRTPNTTWITLIDENSDWIAANDPCTLEFGNGWRLPTSTEWINVDASGPWNDWNGPWNSDLKLHAAGYMHQSSGSLVYRGANGLYYSSTQADNSNADYILFHSGGCGMTSYYKAYAFPVRCLRD